MASAAERAVKLGRRHKEIAIWDGETGLQGLPVWDDLRKGLVPLTSLERRLLLAAIPRLRFSGGSGTR